MMIATGVLGGSCDNLMSRQLRSAMAETMAKGFKVNWILGWPEKTGARLYWAKQRPGIGDPG